MAKLAVGVAGPLFFPNVHRLPNQFELHSGRTRMATSTSTEHPKIEFHISGFGPFHGVDDNPTKSMVSHLKNEILETKESDWKVRKNL